jgi:hypothetical protein
MAELESVFDVMKGLERPTHAVALPHNIMKVEMAHEYAVAGTHPAPILAPGTGMLDSPCKSWAHTELFMHVG